MGFASRADSYAAHVKAALRVREQLYSIGYLIAGRNASRGRMAIAKLVRVPGHRMHRTRLRKFELPGLRTGGIVAR